MVAGAMQCDSSELKEIPKSFGVITYLVSAQLEPLAGDAVILEVTPPTWSRKWGEGVREGDCLAVGCHCYPLWGGNGCHSEDSASGEKILHNICGKAWAAAIRGRYGSSIQQMCQTLFQQSVLLKIFY